MKQDSAANRAMRWLGGIGLGAAAMYLTDPDRGKRRRALARDKIQSLAVRTGNAIDLASRDFGNRMQGLRAQAGRMVLRRKYAMDDPVVEARVRTRIGRVVTHPHAIKVMMQRGRVSLNGPVLAHELDGLLSAVRSVPGVTGIDDQLQVHESSGDIPSLQGAGRTRPTLPAVLQDNWPPALRAMAVAGGSLFSYAGMRRRTPGSLLLATLGAGLLMRGMINRPLLGSTQSARRGQAIHLNKTIHIEASPETVFDFWSHFENFPHFMSHVSEVRNLGAGRSHWMVSGPAGIPVEWDAVLTESSRPGKLAWRTDEDAPVRHTGEVHFEPELTGTRVSVHMSYAPPAGAIGHVLASLLGADPKREMDDDLMRMKAFIETGIPPHDAAQPFRPSDQRPGAALH